MLTFSLRSFYLSETICETKIYFAADEDNGHVEDAENRFVKQHAVAQRLRHYLPS